MSDRSYFVVIGTDRPGTRDVRARVRSSHREYLRAQTEVQVLAAGPTLTDDGAVMNGTFLLVAAPTRQAVDEFLAGDPYRHAGLFRDVMVRRFDWTLGKPADAA